MNEVRTVPEDPRFAAARAAIALYDEPKWKRQRRRRLAAGLSGKCARNACDRCINPSTGCTHKCHGDEPLPPGGVS